MQLQSWDRENHRNKKHILQKDFSSKIGSQLFLLQVVGRKVKELKYQLSKIKHTSKCIHEIYYKSLHSFLRSFISATLFDRFSVLVVLK